MLRTFQKNDVLRSTIKTYPKYQVYFYEQKTYVNGGSTFSGSFVGHLNHVKPGSISLDELNVDRPSGSLIYPFMYKNSGASAFKSLSSANYHTSAYGTTLQGTYPISSSIQKYEYALNSARPYVSVLKNVCDYYKIFSNHCAYSSSNGDKGTQALGLLAIPAIFFGDSIKKGSVKLDYYLDGVLTGRLRDERKNGELVQTDPVGSVDSGSVAGVVLYDHGVVLLTGSWTLSGEGAGFKWYEYASCISGSTTTPQQHYLLEFQGINKINTLTMFCHAPRGEINHSNNPTFVLHSSSWSAMTSSTMYAENPYIQTVNAVSTSYAETTGSYEKTVYISKIGVYDENKNLIAIAKLANPVRKREHDNLTFKLGIDLV